MNNIIKFFADLLLKILLFFRIPKNTAEKLVQFVEFCVVGLSNTLISYIVYAIFVLLNWNYIAGSIVGFVVSVTNSFYWNNKYVFKEENGERRSIIKTYVKTFLSYAVTGLVLANILLVIWVEILHFPELLGPIVNLIITIPINFILNKLWAFKNK